MWVPISSYFLVKWNFCSHKRLLFLSCNELLGHLLFSEQNIVADMRKVLAKNPQVEQQRLHRRIFLDNIDPESQALLVNSFMSTFYSIVFWSVKWKQSYLWLYFMNEFLETCSILFEYLWHYENVMWNSPRGLKIIFNYCVLLFRDKYIVINIYLLIIVGSN